MILWYITCKQRREFGFWLTLLREKESLSSCSTPHQNAFPHRATDFSVLIYWKKAQVKYRDLGNYCWAKGHFTSVIWFLFRALGVPLQFSEQPQPRAQHLSSSGVNTCSQVGRLSKEWQKHPGQRCPRPLLSSQWLQTLPNTKARGVLKPPKQKRAKWVFQIPWMLSVCKHNVACSTSEPEFQQHHNKVRVI